MRLYSFTNMYISDIQKGIQTAHIVSDLFDKYNVDTSQTKAGLVSWAKEHKTIIVLNGGFAENLYDLEEFFSAEENYHAWAAFNEEHAALDGARTAIGIVLPDVIYELASFIRKNRMNLLTAIRLRDELSEAHRTRNYEGLMQLYSAKDLDFMESFQVRDRSDWELELCVKMNEFNLA